MEITVKMDATGTQLKVTATVEMFVELMSTGMVLAADATKDSSLFKANVIDAQQTQCSMGSDVHLECPADNAKILTHSSMVMLVCVFLGIGN
jgi:hypothetical protein